MKVEILGTAAGLTALLEAAQGVEGNLFLLGCPPSMKLPAETDQLAEFYEDLRNSRRQPGELPLFADKGWTGNTSVARALEFMRKHIQHIEARAAVVEMAKAETGYTCLTDYMKAHMGFAASMSVDDKEAENVVQADVGVSFDCREVALNALRQVCAQFAGVGMLVETTPYGDPKCRLVRADSVTDEMDAQAARDALRKELGLA